MGAFFVRDVSAGCQYQRLVLPETKRASTDVGSESSGTCIRSSWWGDRKSALLHRKKADDQWVLAIAGMAKKSGSCAASRSVTRFIGRNYLDRTVQSEMLLRSNDVTPSLACSVQLLRSRLVRRMPLRADAQATIFLNTLLGRRKVAWVLRPADYWNSSLQKLRK